MIPNLHATDFASIGPLIILLVGGLILLIIESVGNLKKLCACTACATLVLALVVAIIAPESRNSLLTHWLRFDKPALFFEILFLAIALCIILLSLSFFQRAETSEGDYYFLLLSAVAGLVLISSSADFLTLFLGIETLSIPLYILCGYMKRWGLSSESAIKYFLMGAIASAFLIYGVAFIYGATGSTQLEMLKSYQQIEAGVRQVLFVSGLALVTLGLAFKAALVPFHLWAPDVYEGAPTPVTAFMAVGTKAGAFAAFTLLYLFFLPQGDLGWSQGIALLAILSLIYANLVALRQQQLRRFFAYSGISHAAFLLIPVVSGTAEAFQAIAFYLVVYSAATLGAFAALVFLESGSYEEKGIKIADLQGLFGRHPKIALVLALSLLTLAGIPPTAGFFAKFFVLKLAFQSGQYPLLIVGLLTSILSAYYYIRIAIQMFTGIPQQTQERAPLLPGAAIVALFSFLALLFLIIYPAPLLQILK